jgi:hypothetical protein
VRERVGEREDGINPIKNPALWRETARGEERELKEIVGASLRDGSNSRGPVLSPIKTGTTTAGFPPHLLPVSPLQPRKGSLR